MQNSLIREFETYLEENKNTQRAAWDKNYLYTSNTHYGLNSTQMKSFLKTHRQEILSQSREQTLKQVEHLWASNIFEMKILAINLLSLIAENLAPSDFTLFEKLVRESKAWVYLDNLVIPVMEVLLEKYPISYKLLKAWIEEEDYWMRRSALLAQIGLFRKGRGDVQLFLALAKSQLDEAWLEKKYTGMPDILGNKNGELKRARFFIRKAIGWTLREMCKHYAHEVKAFLHENKDKMAGLTYKEGSRKLK